jgi:hypothetical protein
LRILLLKIKTPLSAKEAARDVDGDEGVGGWVAFNRDDNRFRFVAAVSFTTTTTANITACRHTSPGVRVAGGPSRNPPFYLPPYATMAKNKREKKKHYTTKGGWRKEKPKRKSVTRINRGIIIIIIIRNTWVRKTAPFSVKRAWMRILHFFRGVC